MTLMLTSSPCDNRVPEGAALPCIFDVRNGFVDRLRELVSPGAACGIIAADPQAHDLNDEMAATFAGCFAYHGMPLSAMTMVDDRNEEALADVLAACGVIILAGGHVPTQNAFFRRLRLPQVMAGYEGLVMGISAGSMNCAGTVYAQPEEPGEAVDPDYQRFIPGLGLSRINVLPHYQRVKDYTLDGMRLFEDITYGDSWGRLFIALADGSYILARQGQAEVFGEAYAIADGRCRPLCGEGECRRIQKAQS